MAIFSLQEKNPDFYVKRFWQNFSRFPTHLAHRLLSAKQKIVSITTLAVSAYAERVYVESGRPYSP